MEVTSWAMCGPVIAGMKRIRRVLFDVKNRIIRPYLAAMHRILICQC
jgi:hypothetical protein